MKSPRSLKRAPEHGPPVTARAARDRSQASREHAPRRAAVVAQEEAGSSPHTDVGSTPSRSKSQKVGAREEPAMRSVGLDFAVGKIAFCEVAAGQIVHRGTVRDVEALEQLLGARTGKARVTIEGCRSSS